MYLLPNIGYREVKGVFAMQKNRVDQNKTEELTIKGIALHMCRR